MNSIHGSIVRAVAMVLCGLMDLSSISGHLCIGNENMTTWMTKNAAVLKSKRLSELIIPGTRSSGSFSLDQDRSRAHPQGEGAEFLVRAALNWGFSSSVISWTRRQDGDLSEQLEAGYRYLQLRVAEDSNGVVRYWERGLLGGRIESGIKEVAAFCRAHPREVVMMGLSCFTQGSWAPSGSRTSGAMKMIHGVLGELLVPASVGKDPTINEILTTGKSVIVFVQSDKCGSESDIKNYFWDDRENNTVTKSPEMDDEDAETMHGQWESLLSKEMRGTIESLKTGSSYAGLRLVSLNSGSAYAAIKCSVISHPCIIGILMAVAFIAGYVLTHRNYKRRKGKGVIWRNFSFRMPRLILPARRHRPVIIGGIFAAAVALAYFLAVMYRLDACRSHRSMLRYAAHLHARGVDTVSRKCRVTHPHCRGYDSLISHWLTRPGRYLPGIILVDAFRTSKVVQLAIRANVGRLKREVTVTYQGSPIAGARDVRGYFSCPSIILAHVVVSRDEAKVVTWSRIAEGEVVRFQEGEFPMDSTLVLCVGTVWGVWIQLYSGNIQKFISETRDLYIRGSESRAGKGIAYISDRYDAVGRSCRDGVPGGVLNATIWNESTLQRKELPPKHYLRPTPEV